MQTIIHRTDNNKALQYSTGNYTEYPVIDHKWFYIYILHIGFIYTLYIQVSNQIEEFDKCFYYCWYRVIFKISFLDYWKKL